MAEDFQNLELNGKDRFQFTSRIWKGIMFCFHGFMIKKNMERYPVLAAHLSKMPNLDLASVSILEPGSYVLPYNGNANGVARYHLGLNIPAKMPECGFIIAGNELRWEKGMSFRFCNMNVHSAHNKTNRRRHILLLDVIRPEFIFAKKKLCVYTLAKRRTNITSDHLRDIFHEERSRFMQDLTKEMIYKANKGYQDHHLDTIP